MRIHPATGFILERQVPESGVTLHGVHLPKGTVVGVNAWVLHYNKDVFGDDAHVFRPERWIEGDEENIKDMKRNMFAVRDTSLHTVTSKALAFSDWSTFPSVACFAPTTLPPPHISFPQVLGFAD